MGESNWTKRLVIGLRPGARDAAAVQIGARFDGVEAAVRDLETRVAALEAIKAPTVAPEPFTCGPGHAALVDPSAARFAGVPVVAEVEEVDDAPTCEPGACELALLTRQRDALAMERDELRATVERVREWARRLHRDSIWQREVGAALEVLAMLDDTDTPKREADR